MDATIARGIAHYSHAGRLDGFGTPLIEHVERVAAAVPGELRAVAYLHDVLEHSDTPLSELAAAGLEPVELEALHLLTRAAGESYEAHTLRIAFARGRAGTIGRAIRLAELADHLDRPEARRSGPPYGWARTHIATGQARRDPAPS